MSAPTPSPRRLQVEEVLGTLAAVGFYLLVAYVGAHMGVTP